MMWWYDMAPIFCSVILNLIERLFTFNQWQLLYQMIHGVPSANITIRIYRFFCFQPNTRQLFFATLPDKLFYYQTDSARKMRQMSHDCIICIWLFFRRTTRHSPANHAGILCREAHDAARAGLGHNCRNKNGTVPTSKPADH